jgi:hypothetical protein
MSILRQVPTIVALREAQMALCAFERAAAAELGVDIGFGRR